MTQGDEGRRRLDHTQRHGAAALAIGVLGLGLFTWPFVRTPPLDLGSSYAHLLGAWVVVVAALAGLSARLGREDRGGDPDA